MSLVRVLVSSTIAMLRLPLAGFWESSTKWPMLPTSPPLTRTASTTAPTPRPSEAAYWPKVTEPAIFDCAGPEKMILHRMRIPVTARLNPDTT